jgi:nucleoside-diphosphate-sugar epimerase
MTSERKTILITGAAGFIGQMLAAHLLNESSDNRILLTDVITPSVPSGVKYPESASTLAADLTDAGSLRGLIQTAQPLTTVFVFHGIMSSGSEADPELSLRVNLEATRLLFFELAKANPGARVIYASSQAV